MGLTELGLVFLSSAAGLFGEASSGPESHSSRDPWAWSSPARRLGTSALPGQRPQVPRGLSEIWAAKWGSQGVGTQAGREEGGRRRCGMSLSGSESYKLLLRFFKRSWKDTFRSFVRHRGP